MAKVIMFFSHQKTLREQKPQACQRVVTYSPPKSCMPSSAKMRMKRKRRKRSENAAHRVDHRHHEVAE